ncbi:MAG: helix-turn-helix transcriptional regulator [Candidatus Obscuribacterales bacterium]|nr:helix-turn-helix transcriptional regulator [Candidatus Obscuribacterales bacterium]
MNTKVSTQPRSECVISNVLEVLGDKWTLLVVRDLFFFNKHEYKEFLCSPEAIATNILSERLKRLVSAGVIAEQVHPENKSRKFYYLTVKGKNLLPVLIEMAKWGMMYFPDLAAMQSLYARIASDENGLKEEILASIEDWESSHLIPR